MERAMSVEDRIKRAEEIYYRKKQNQNINNNYARVPVKSKKDYKIYRKMIIQVIICLVIYFVFYYVVNNNNVFSEDFTNKTKEVLSYDINLGQLYNDASNYIKGLWEEMNNKESENDANLQDNKKDESQTEEQNSQVESVKEGENEQINQQEINQKENSQQVDENQKSNNQENINNQNTTMQENLNIGGAEEVMQELSQMEKDCIDIKKITSYIVPTQGYISSKFGWRDPTTSTVPKYHTGLDIAAVIGTEIKSATNGTVILASSEGDYGNHLKIQIEDIIMVYAHCNVLCVKEGDYVTQGQKIAEVGTTGNSTGPHLHFEIRKSGRHVDPQMILNI